MITRDDGTAVTVLGLGAMGRRLAATLVGAGYPTTVWNRSPGKADRLVGRGAVEADTVGEAVSASPLVVACLLDQASVHEVLDPVGDRLAGRALVNVTTTTPRQARELAGWAAGHGIAYLDGGIMAVPEMIGQPGAAVLYSGDEAVFEARQALLGLWGESSYVGADAGMASLWDLAMLSGMYVMFAGFLHGAAMVATEGVSAGELAARATPFLAAMTGALPELAAIVDGADYTAPGQQSLEFSDLTDLLEASVDQGVGVEVIRPVQAMIERQVAAGHGQEGFARIYEELRRPAA